MFTDWYLPLGIRSSGDVDPVRVGTAPEGLKRRVTMFVDLIREAGIDEVIWVTSYLRSSGIHATGRAIDLGHTRPIMELPEVRAAWSRAAWLVNVAYPYDGVRGSVVYRVRSSSAGADVIAAHPDWDWDHVRHAHIQTPEGTCAGEPSRSVSGRWSREAQGAGCTGSSVAPTGTASSR